MGSITPSYDGYTGPEPDWHPRHGVATLKYSVAVERTIKGNQESEEITLQFVTGLLDLRVGDRLLLFVNPWIEDTYGAGAYETMANLGGGVMELGTGEPVPEAAGLTLDEYADMIAAMVEASAQ
jgi:hypothetical protein